jgi:GNAT superfamily N-acetyltransferase
MHSIRKIKKEDLPQIFDLVKELAHYEKAAHEVTTDVSGYEVDWNAGWFDAIVLEVDREIVGMALYYKAFSTWKGKMLYLEDLIISEAHRGNGYGKLLLQSFYEIARAEGATSAKWQVLYWNTPAIEFYKSEGAHLDPEWINCRKYL